MADTKYVDCRCPDASGRNGWSYSTDDLFCPGCGTPVARLISENQYPANSGTGPLWVYPKPGNVTPCFEVPLFLEYADSERVVQRRKPLLDATHAHLTDVRYFEDGVTVLESPNHSQPLILQLKPHLIGDVFRLPPTGIEYRLQGIAGDFSERELVFKVGEKPSVRIELVGAAIEPALNPDGVVVTASDSLDVQLCIHAVDAPIVILDDVQRNSIRCHIQRASSNSDIRVQFELKDTLEAGTVIHPGTPWSGDAQFDTTALIEGDMVSLTVQVRAHVARISRKDWKLELTRIQKGGLECSPPSLHVPVMFLGECRSNAMNNRSDNPEGPDATGEPPVIRRVFVRNFGKSPVTLRAIVKPEEAGWLSASWALDVAVGSKRPHGTQLELGPDERAEIYIQINLRELQKQCLNEDGALSAKLTFIDLQSGELHEFRLYVNEVKPREACPHPLCIDFGNTSSFAAIRNPSSGLDNQYTPWLTSEVISVHDLSTPERFPTALFFHRFARELASVKYEIGNQAVDESKKHGALVTDLKRWIGHDDHSKTILSVMGDPQSCEVPRLIVLYLLRILERAEAILRRYTIREICVSHPSKYTLKRRESFFQIIDSLCQEVSRQRGLELRQVFAASGTKRTDASGLKRYSGVDEANAVAVGAVFDDNVRTILAEIVSPARPCFTVASFDLGGGSLDTAIIHFEVRKGVIAIPRYTTTYLGIGGHDGFGGDNVTFVVFDLLSGRIKAALEKTGLPAKECMACIPTPQLKDLTDLDRGRNYDVLWRLAEEIKIFQCTHASNPDTAALKPLQHIVAQLSQDLILDPTPGGSLKHDDRVRKVLQQWGESGDYLIPLDEIYDHPVETDLLVTVEPWTIRSRLRESIDELVRLAEQKHVTLDLIIRCGKGSRLPLVDEMLSERLPTARILPDPTSPQTKFLVAHGLVRFLEAGKARHRFARSSDYTCSAFVMGQLDAVRNGNIQLIPNCAPVDDRDTWYQPGTVPSATVLEPVKLSLLDLNQYADRMEVYRVDSDRPPTLHGWFDLTRSPDDPAGGANTPLDDSLIDDLDPIGRVRLNGSERDLELKVTHGEKCLGIWKMRTQAPPNSAAPIS